MDRDFKQYHRGEIYFANLNPAYGCEHGGIRPVLILQNLGNVGTLLVALPIALLLGMGREARYKAGRQKAISADTRCFKQDPRNEI